MICRRMPSHMQTTCHITSFTKFSKLPILLRHVSFCLGYNYLKKNNKKKKASLLQTTHSLHQNILVRVYGSCSCCCCWAVKFQIVGMVGKASLQLPQRSSTRHLSYPAIQIFCQRSNPTSNKPPQVNLMFCNTSNIHKQTISLN